MRSWFTPQELAGVDGMPGTVQGVRKLADRMGWEGQRRIGSKATEYAFALLPSQTQAAILAKAVAASAPAFQGAIEVPLINERDVKSASRLTENQREVMLARLAFCREIERMMHVTTQKAAIDTLIKLGAAGELSPYLQTRMELANDRATGDRTLSERTLKRWLAVWRAAGKDETSLAPLRQRANLEVPDWMPAFLRCYQRPTKPTVAASYAEFVAGWTGKVPSIHAVKRFLVKLSPEALNQGRMSPQELKSVQAFRRRSTKNLLPGDVYTADGHAFDAEVINPLTGKPYRPEITTVLDVATRRVVGVSIGEAESAIGVLDALRDAIRQCMFVIFYVDNGSGFANEKVREVVDRLGGTMQHSLPYNSQARGLSERGHKTIWVNAAKKLTSYIGADMDKHAGTKVHRISRKQLRETGASRLIPEFGVFMTGVEQEVIDYNERPHRALPKISDPATGSYRHMSPNEAWDKAIDDGWEPLTAPASLVEGLIRPQITRTTNRGEISFSGARYFLNDLTAFHGQEIRVGYDVRDASRVWAYTAAGELIGEAILDGNSSDYMPLTQVEIGREKRSQGQYKRAVDKLERLTGNRVELIAPTTAPSANLPAAELAAALEYAQVMVAQQPTFEVPSTDVERYRLWTRLDQRQAAGEELDEQEARWWKGYANHPDLVFQKRIFEEKNAG